MSTSDEAVAQGSGSTQQLRDSARQVKQDVRELGSQMRDVAGAKIGDLKDQAADYYRRGKLRAQAMEEDAIDYIRARPVKSLLVAAGVGLLLGVFFRRR